MALCMKALVAKWRESFIFVSQEKQNHWNELQRDLSYDDLFIKSVEQLGAQSVEVMSYVLFHSH